MNSIRFFIWFGIYIAPNCCLCPSSEQDVYETIIVNSSKYYLARPVRHFDHTLHVNISFTIEHVSEIVRLILSNFIVK